LIDERGSAPGLHSSILNESNLFINLVGFLRARRCCSLCRRSETG
jgi:hypothetical protein